MLFRITNRIFSWFGLTRHPVIKLYDGFGDEDEIIIYGHILKQSPLSRRRYRNNVILNFFGLIRLFMVVPEKGVKVRLEWNGEVKETTSDNEGFFKFEWKPVNPLTPGWHKAKACYISAKSGLALTSAECEVFIPHIYQYSFISDIDDTFLISHSSNLRKRLRVLFTKNAVTREPFKDVTLHYQLLSRAGVSSTEANPFFYVSSSEWNLYEYIRKFCHRYELPRGVFLLSQLKRFRDLLNTGQGKHATKYIRIVRILKCYPHHKYILLGDNSQKDPEIYATVVKDFPEKIFAVYIRNVHALNASLAEKYLKQISDAGVHCCCFKESSEAIDHSRRIGLIQ
ncbi:MAG: hypothetical protein K0S12_2100 [Bacteroidetes bacterium]|nr:hypothetical protein [Bacteroidota bacterium]